jgi:prolyl oligopeptidase
MRPVLLLTIFFCAAVLLHAQSYNYPQTPVIGTEEIINGKMIKDDYRWLEEVHNDDVKKWVTEQNEFTSSYFKKNIQQISAYKEISNISGTEFDMAEKQGKYYFKFLYSAGDDHATPSLFFQEDIKAYPTPLVNPKSISSTDRIELRKFKLSGSGQYLAYQYSRNGSDWMEIRIIDMKSRKSKKEVLKDVRFSEIIWYEDGFYYSRYPGTDNRYGLALGQEIYYHKVGTDQNSDELIYSKGKSSRAELEVQVTSDNRYLIIQERNKSAGEYHLLLKDHTKENAFLVNLLSGPKAHIIILNSHGEDLIALSYYENNNGKIISFNINDPLNWKTIVDELKDGVIVEAKLFKSSLLTIVQSGLSEYVHVYNMRGEPVKVIPFKEGFKVSGLSGNPNDESLDFYYSSFTHPPALFKLDLKTFEYRKFNNLAEFTYDPSSFEYKRVEYPSSDGVMIPMLLVYKKGIKLNSANPALLEAYGGFGAISRAKFNPGLVYFLEQGGVYAYAYIRGGGTKGNEWAVAGRGKNKQRSFDDFIHAAQYLVQNKYTAPKHLAATGVSNGGLVVGVAITQRPDLFGAAVPIVGVFDMLQFEEATIGHFHTDEYGTRTDTASFNRLLSFSPFHNISDQKQYPPLLIITGAYDDRVPAYQSYKFAARLQSLQHNSPVLLRVIPKAGHFGDHSLGGMINQQVEIYSFLLHFIKPGK